MAKATHPDRMFRTDGAGDSGPDAITYGTLCQMSADVTSGSAPADWSFDWADDRQSVDVSWDGTNVQTYRIMPVGW